MVPGTTRWGRLGLGAALVLVVDCGGRSLRQQQSDSEVGGSSTESGGTGTALGGSAGTIGGFGGGQSSGGVGATGGTDAAGGGGGTCAHAVYEVSRITQNFFFALDRSEALAGVRWNRAFETLLVLFSDQSLAGTGVALGVFPDIAVPPTCNDVTCRGDACGVPLVELGMLSAQGAPQDAQEFRLALALGDLTPDGAAPPLAAALEGALAWAERHRGERPEERAHVVLIASGEEDACSGSPADIAGRAFDAFGIATFVLGFEDGNLALFDRIALAGGTERALVLGNEPEVNAAALLGLTRPINGGLITCDFEIPLPDPGLGFDPTKVNVALSLDGVSVPLFYVRSVEACLDEFGWYYDDESNPERIVLCPASCAAFASGDYDALEVHVACGNPLPP